MKPDILKIITCAIFIYLIACVTGCDDSTKSKFTGELTGKWQLTDIGGTLHDICPGETVEFTNTSRATLKCPNEEPVQRTYRIYPDDVLNYIESNVKYVIVTLDATKLQLSGLGAVSGRFLTYSRINGDNSIEQPESNGDVQNSSEPVK